MHYFLYSHKSCILVPTFEMNVLPYDFDMFSMMEYTIMCIILSVPYTAHYRLIRNVMTEGCTILRNTQR